MQEAARPLLHLLIARTSLWLCVGVVPLLCGDSGEAREQSSGLEIVPALALDEPHEVIEDRLCPPLRRPDGDGGEGHGELWTSRAASETPGLGFFPFRHRGEDSADYLGADHRE